MATATQQKQPNGQTVAQQTMDEATKRVMDKMLRETVSWNTPDATEEINLNIESVRKLFANPTKTGKLPSDRECWLFLQMCKARGLNPYLGDAYLVGYDEGASAKFNLITAHQALMKRAEASGKKTGMESGVILIDNATKEIVETVGDFYLEDRHKLVGAWCKVYRSDYDKPVYERVKLSIYDKGYSRWKADPAGMIVKVAEASAHRLAFPAEVGGLYVHEEMEGDHLSDERKTDQKRATRSSFTPDPEKFGDDKHAEDASQVAPDENPDADPPRESGKRPSRQSVKESREVAADGQEIPEGALFDSGNPQPD